MSNARKCDVCGRLFVGYLNDSSQSYHRLIVEEQSILLGHNTGQLDSYDLCEKCAASLNKWLESQDGEEC